MDVVRSSSQNAHRLIKNNKNGLFIIGEMAERYFPRITEAVLSDSAGWMVPGVPIMRKYVLQHARYLSQSTGNFPEIE